MQQAEDLAQTSGHFVIIESKNKQDFISQAESLHANGYELTHYTVALNPHIPDQLYSGVFERRDGGLGAAGESCC
jgi:hypothetical protein